MVVRGAGCAGVLAERGLPNDDYWRAHNDFRRSNDDFRMPLVMPVPFTVTRENTSSGEEADDVG